MINLKRIRQEKGLSQAQLASKAQVSLRAIQYYEQERDDINKAAAITIYKLAQALEVSMESLLQ